MSVSADEATLKEHLACFPLSHPCHAALSRLVVQARKADRLQAELLWVVNYRPIASLWSKQEDVDRISALLGLSGQRVRGEDDGESRT